MNVHFLELFYYVARHGGITEAARHIPYGIQQPAVSSQMGKLEADLNVKLFERRPFRLTAAGEKLYAYVGPFFDQQEAVAKSLRETEVPTLSVGAAELILRDHLPVVFREVKKQFPRLKISLRSLGFNSEAERWLERGEVDVAFVPLRTRAPRGFNRREIIRLPLALQVSPELGIKTSEELFTQKVLTLPLIGLPETSTISEAFQRALKQRGIRWSQTVEAGSLDLVSRYVANGDGVGITVLLDPQKRTPGVRTLTLNEFGFVTVGALWRKEMSLAANAAVEAVHAYVRRFWPDRAV